MSRLIIPRAARKAAPIVFPSITFCLAIAALGALTPLPVSAHPHFYMNTQFVEGRSPIEQSGHLVIRNTSILPRTVYARFELPGDRANRNNGFVYTVPPLSQIAYALPLGVRVFACDGKYWDDYRPDEAYAVTIREAQTYTFTTRQFKPAALRRANGE